jgi:K+-transporting ATPase ATPase C chain
MKTNIFPAIKLTVVCILFFSGFYTLAVWGMALVVAPNQGKGETVQVNGKTVGYAHWPKIYRRQILLVAPVCG